MSGYHSKLIASMLGVKHIENMGQYRIAVWEEQSGYVTIEAKNKEEAKEMVEERLNSHGIDGFDNIDVTHRNVELV